MDQTIDYYVYTDGACSNNGRSNARAGIGIYFGPNDSRNVSKRIDAKEKQTNNVAEVIAIIETFPIIKSALEQGAKIVICSDSAYALNCLKKYGAKQEKIGWTKDIPNKNLIKKLYELYKNIPNVFFMHIKAHTNNSDVHSLGNAQADYLANLAIEKNNSDVKKIWLNVPYSNKDEIKKLGGRWNSEKKCWYILNNNPNKSDILKKFDVV